jgi:hypothetical protein
MHANSECPTYKEKMSQQLIRASDVVTISLPGEPNLGQALRGFASEFVGTAWATADPEIPIRWRAIPK